VIYGLATWQSPVAWPRRWLAAVFAVSAAYAGVLALTSSEPVHRLWGEIAACGYGVALLCVLLPDLALGAAVLGALVVPLTVLAVRGMRQPEVDVIARSASLLIHHGTPYESAAQLAATTDPNAYNPYLPVMALFGLPRAIFGGGLWTDPRVWFALVFVVAFGWALRIGGAVGAWRWTALIAASPIVALELSAGGDDGPMVAFLCLGFAVLAARSRPAVIWSGLALGLAAGMKSTTWPALAVAFALLVVRDGWRPAIRFAIVAVAVVAVCVGPFLTGPEALADNTIKFPLGLTSVRSDAASPLPGHLIAGLGHAGHTIVVVLLVLAAMGVAAILVTRPPGTVARAVLLLAGAMTLMFILAPSTRFGYFIYPGTLVLWLIAVRSAPRADDQAARPAGERMPHCASEKPS
jgi:Glycosyltransferase family 87